MPVFFVFYLTRYELKKFINKNRLNIFNAFLKNMAHFFCNVARNNKLGIKKSIKRKRLKIIFRSFEIAAKFGVVEAR